MTLNATQWNASFGVAQRVADDRVNLKVFSAGTTSPGTDLTGTTDATIMAGVAIPLSVMTAGARVEFDAMLSCSDVAGAGTIAFGSNFGGTLTDPLDGTGCAGAMLVPDAALAAAGVFVYRYIGIVQIVGATSLTIDGWGTLTYAPATGTAAAVITMHSATGTSPGVPATAGTAIVYKFTTALGAAADNIRLMAASLCVTTSTTELQSP